MRRVLCLALAFISILSYLSMEVGAVDASVSDNVSKVGSTRASGSFNMSVGAYKKAAADTTFPLAAGETVHIRANYAPEDASVDFGLIDSEEVFHYVNATMGSIDVTIEVPETGNYTFAVKNNSGTTVKVSGIVNY